MLTATKSAAYIAFVYVVRSSQSLTSNDLPEKKQFFTIK